MALLCVMGNQQKDDVHYQLGELMRATEVGLFVAMAAKHGLDRFQADTKQAFLKGEIGEEKI